MSKANRLRGRRTPKPAAFSSPELAPDSPAHQPSGSIDEFGTTALERWQIRQQTLASMILLEYLRCLDAGRDGQSALVRAPTHAQHGSHEDARAADLNNVVIRLQEFDLGPASAVADILSRSVAPRLVHGVADGILAQGRDYLRDKPIQATAWSEGAQPFLQAVCPPHHHRAAEALSRTLAQVRLTWDEDLVQASADQPVAFIHAAAALVANLYQHPGVIPDPLTVRLKLAERTEALVGHLFWALP